MKIYQKYHLDILVITPIVLCVFILIGKLLIFGKVLFWGTPSLQFIPWWFYAWNEVRSMQFPFWNPYNGMGIPLFANYQLALLYPPNWLLFLFAEISGAPGISIGYTVLEAFHLIFGGIGMALFLRKLHIDKLGQIVGGLGFCMSQYFIARSGFYSMIWAGVWLPWLVYFADILINKIGSDENLKVLKIRGEVFPLVIVLIFQLFAGHAQITWYSLLFLLAWSAFRIFHFKNKLTWMVGIAHLAGAIFLAALISCVQLIPTFEYLRESYRASALGYEEALTYSYWPWRLITIVFPDFFGNPATQNYWGYAAFWEDATYIGILPTIAAISSLAQLFKRHTNDRSLGTNQIIFFFMVFSLISLLLSMGKNTPIFPFLFTHIPTFNLFQAPARYMLWWVFSWCVLAGIGVNTWKPPTGKLLYWSRLSCMAAFAIMVGSLLAYRFLPSAKLTFIYSFGVSGFWMLGTGLLNLTIPNIKTGLRWAVWMVMVVCWVMADLLFSNWGLVPGISATTYTTKAVDNRFFEPKQREYISLDDEYDLKIRQYFRFDVFRPEPEWIDLRKSSLPNLNLLDQKFSANNFDPLIPKRYWIWMEFLNTTRGDTLNQFLNLMGVERVISVNNSEKADINIRQNSNSDLFRWYTCFRIASDDKDAWKKLIEIVDQEQVDQVLVVEDYDKQKEECQLKKPISLKIETYKSTELDLRVESSSHGWLFISQQWYPGWKVEIDGLSSKLYRANYIFQALPLPEGVHQVRIFYDPSIFYIGFGFTGLGLMIIIVLILLKNREKLNTWRKG